MHKREGREADLARAAIAQRVAFKAWLDGGHGAPVKPEARIPEGDATHDLLAEIALLNEIDDVCVDTELSDGVWRVCLNDTGHDGEHCETPERGVELPPSGVGL